MVLGLRAPTLRRPTVAGDVLPVFTREGKLLPDFSNQRDITKGAPPALPDYRIGRADMLEDGQKRFQGLLLDLLDKDGSSYCSFRHVGLLRAGWYGRILLLLLQTLLTFGIFHRRSGKARFRRHAENQKARQNRMKFKMISG